MEPGAHVLILVILKKSQRETDDSLAVEIQTCLIGRTKYWRWYEAWHKRDVISRVCITYRVGYATYLAVTIPIDISLSALKRLHLLYIHILTGSYETKIVELCKILPQTPVCGHRFPFDLYNSYWYITICGENDVMLISSYCFIFSKTHKYRFVLFLFKKRKCTTSYPFIFFSPNIIYGLIHISTPLYSSWYKATNFDGGYVYCLVLLPMFHNYLLSWF
jgi:hypothetical protein